jgi:hypothetical protein
MNIGKQSSKTDRRLNMAYSIFYNNNSMCGRLSRALIGKLILLMGGN